VRSVTNDGLLKSKHVAVLKHETRSCVGQNIKVLVTEPSRETAGLSQ
jgi:hypothetical protein